SLPTIPVIDVPADLVLGLPVALLDFALALSKHPLRLRVGEAPRKEAGCVRLFGAGNEVAFFTKLNSEFLDIDFGAVLQPAFGGSAGRRRRRRDRVGSVVDSAVVGRPKQVAFC